LDHLVSNSTILGTLTKNQQSLTAMMPKYLDFCDLLLNPTKKLQLGGTRNEMQNTLDEVHDCHLQKSQLGILGTFQIEKDIFSFGDIDSKDQSSHLLRYLLMDIFSSSVEFELALSNICLSGLDTFKNPLTFLHLMNHAHMFKNELNIGNRGSGCLLNIALEISAGLFGVENVISFSFH
jgi:hypothetical protein